MKQLNIERRDGVLVLTVALQELTDAEQIASIGSQMLEAASAGPETSVLVDLNQVSFMSSLMVGKLVMLSNRCKSKGIELRLCRLTPAVHEVFQILNLQRLMQAHPTREEAVAAFRLTTRTASTQPLPERFEVVRQRAEQGDASAQYELGQRYAEACGVSEDMAAALTWYRRAAEQNHSGAQYALGNAHAFGIQVVQDYDKALQWYRQAADRGHDEAQYQLGLAYAHGLAVEQDHAEAAAWFRQAADAGNHAAQTALADLYREGLGVPASREEALRWYRKAAEQGDARADEILKSLSP